MAVAGRADAAGTFRHDDASIISEGHVAVNLKCANVVMLPIPNSQYLLDAVGKRLERAERKP